MGHRFPTMKNRSLLNRCSSVPHRWLAFCSSPATAIFSTRSNLRQRRREPLDRLFIFVKRANVPAAVGGEHRESLGALTGFVAMQDGEAVTLREAHLGKCMRELVQIRMAQTFLRIPHVEQRAVDATRHAGERHL